MMEYLQVIGTVVAIFVGVIGAVHTIKKTFPRDSVKLSIEEKFEVTVQKIPTKICEKDETYWILDFKKRIEAQTDSQGVYPLFQKKEQDTKKLDEVYSVTIRNKTDYRVVMTGIKYLSNGIKAKQHLVVEDFKHNLFECMDSLAFEPQKELVFYVENTQYLQSIEFVSMKGLRFEIHCSDIEHVSIIKPKFIN